MFPATSDILLALRYLRPKRTFISLITLLSVIGPILGVALLIIVIAVMSGFDRDIRERILSLQAHVTVYPQVFWGGSSGVIEEPQPVLTVLERMNIKGAPLIEGPILIQQRQQVEAKYLRGILPEAEKQVTSIHKSCRGRYEIKYGEALIGEEMAIQMGLRLGDSLLIHSPARITAGIKWDDTGRIRSEEVDEVSLPEEVVITGIFSMGLHEFDSSIVMLHLDHAAELFGYGWGSATSVHGKVENPFKMTGLNTELEQLLPGHRIITWQEANRQLFSALRVEKNLMFFLLFFIVLVAAFGISGTLITVVVQKTKEIGILKAVGAGRGLVARIFLLQGAIIGVLGTTFGIGLGLLIVHYRNKVAEILAWTMGVEIFPKELYHLSQIPALIKPGDVFVIAGVAFLICIGAALIPALYASLLSPAAALREDA